MRGLLASPLALFVGFALGALGGGGSILAVPALVYGAGQSPSAATTTSLLVILVNLASALTARGGGDAVDWGVALPFSAAALNGVAAGTRVADRLGSEALLRGFSGLLVAAAVATSAQAALAL